MVVVCDTGPIIALHQIGQLSLLPALFGHVFISQAVHGELIRFRSEIQKSSWLSVSTVSDVLAVEVLRERLDAGESEAITLALEIKRRSIHH